MRVVARVVVRMMAATGTVVFLVAAPAAVRLGIGAVAGVGEVSG